jgi:hypothetical protein
MSAPQHDPELFDELMRAELGRQPVNRFAIVTLVSGLLGGLLAPVFAAVAIVQIKKRQQRGRVLVICGLVAFAVWGGVVAYQAASGSTWWQRRAQQAHQERLPEGVVHGLDVTAGDCFWSPPASGATDVVRRSCTEPHTAEAFEVLPLEAGPMPDIVDVYHRTLARCEADARPIAGVRVQVITPTTETWDQGKHRAICYYRFATDLTAPAR